MIAINTTALAITLFLTVFTTQSHAKKSIKVIDHPNGEVSQVLEYEDDKISKTITYATTGQLTTEKFFTKAGELEEINSYIDGKIAESFTYYPSGKTAAHIQWHGTATKATFHYVTGEVEEVSKYVNGLLTTTTFYEKSGKVKTASKSEPIKSNTDMNIEASKK